MRIPSPHGIALLLLLACVNTGAEETQPATTVAVDTLFPSNAAADETASADQAVQELTAQLMKINRVLRQVEARIQIIEERLGPGTRPPSLTTQIERRLADIERRLDRIDQQLTRMQQWETRLRRLETKRP